MKKKTKTERLVTGFDPGTFGVVGRHHTEWANEAVVKKGRREGINAVLINFTKQLETISDATKFTVERCLIYFSKVYAQIPQFKMPYEIRLQCRLL